MCLTWPACQQALSGILPRLAYWPAAVLRALGPATFRLNSASVVLALGGSVSELFVQDENLNGFALTPS
ncbi:hypothetical protein BH20ACI3_BH20ACI3_29790 [soil metagenome]